LGQTDSVVENTLARANEGAALAKRWDSVAQLAAIAALALVIACRKNKSIAAEEIERVAKWTAWFDAAFHELPTAASPPAAPSDWVEARSSDGVRVRLGRDYRRRNDNCWATGTEQGPGWRDVCVNAMNAALFSISNPARQIPTSRIRLNSPAGEPKASPSATAGPSWNVHVPAAVSVASK
jgi:hypothetical protein